jgi:hypothetical protein
MALPNTTMAPQQSGVDPLTVQKQQNQNQKIAEILAGIESRLNNVTNMRSNVQMSAFNAFGNNFVTRGMTQLTDSLLGSFESLFKSPEKEMSDPVVEQLKKQYALLEVIAKAEPLRVQGSDSPMLVIEQLEKQYTLLEAIAKDSSTNAESITKPVVQQLEKHQQLLETIIGIETNRDAAPNLVVQQLEKHQQLLETVIGIGKAANNSSEELLTLLRLDIKNNRKLDHIDSTIQINKLDDIKSAIENSFSKPETASTFSKYTSGYADTTSAPTPPTASILIDKADITPAQKSESTSASKFRAPESTVKQIGPKKVSPVESLLSNILSVLADTNKNIKQMLKPEKISTQEETLESLQNPKRISDIQPNVKSPKGDRPSFIDKLFDKDANILGFKNVLSSLTNVFKKVMGVASPLLRIFPALGSAVVALMSLIKKIPVGKALTAVAGAAAAAGKLIFGKKSAGSIPTIDVPTPQGSTPKPTTVSTSPNKTTKPVDVSVPNKTPSDGSVPNKTTKPVDVSVPNKAPSDVPTPQGSTPKPTTPPVKSSGLWSKVGKIAKASAPALIAAAVGMGVDTAIGSFGVGKNVVNEEQDDKNWERASTIEKVESAIPRGIEKVGSFLGFDNLVNESRNARISTETKYLDNKLASLESKQTVTQKQQTQQKIAPVINNITNNNAQNIMPVRQSVKNQDDSFNRYLTSIM